ncbi:MAG: signal peptidase II [Proteobacteria bacterium]|nr:signal peptidase II [Pseudomonadota bacterium]MBU2226994.1 signal peptidase II [Pseudomonadota bacterium]MBU2260764.1 signal peptidase II [Pseudomonadota bacterium]
MPGESLTDDRRKTRGKRRYGKGAGRLVLRRENCLFLTIAAVVVVLDQLTKAWIISTLHVHDSFAVIGGFFNITHVRNPGAAFGFLAGAFPLFRSIFFLAVTAAAIALIIHYLRTTRIKSLPLVFSLALILAGAVGNLIDRVRFGEVVDFLDFHVGAHHWPAFNVADAAITTGAVVMVAILLRRRKERPQEGG